jgi:hypothetical protein
MHDHRLSMLSRERQLRSERAALEGSGRMLIVVVEAALSNGHSTLLKAHGDGIGVALGVKPCGIVRVYPDGPPHKAGIALGDALGALCRRQGLPYAHNTLASRGPNATQHLREIVGEGGITEVGV